jgi:hypothetical protein
MIAMVLDADEVAGFIGKSTGSGTLRYDPDLPEPVVRVS